MVTEAEGAVVFELYRQPQFGASGVLLVDTVFAHPSASMFAIGDAVVSTTLGVDVTLPLTVDNDNRMVLAMADGVRSVRFEVMVANDTQ